MALKLVLISPSGTLEKDQHLHADVINSVAGLISRLNQAGVRVAIWSNRRLRVNAKDGSSSQPLEEFISQRAGCPVEYVGLAAGMPARQRSNSVQPILNKFGVKLHETILVGAREEDMRAGVNNKLLLLRPSWYRQDLAYGFEVSSIEALARFCLLFGIREHPFYWQINDPARSLSANALGPFSTINQAYAQFGEDARAAAKYEAGTLDFWHQLITSTLYFSGIIHEVDYITLYPGHSREHQIKAFHEVLDLLGKCFRKSFLPNLFIRHQTAVKSTTLKANARLFANQINTIHINNYANKLGAIEERKTPLQLRGKTVLVVDDICTSGRSLDVARAYLASAGAGAILFSWLKTINTSFLSMEPSPQLAPFRENIINSEPSSLAYSYSDNIVDQAAAAEIDNLLNQFRLWKI